MNKPTPQTLKNPAELLKFLNDVYTSLSAPINELPFNISTMKSSFSDANNYAAFLADIAACPVGGGLYVPPAQYNIKTNGLVITKPMTIFTPGMRNRYGGDISDTPYLNFTAGSASNAFEIQEFGVRLEGLFLVSAGYTQSPSLTMGAIPVGIYLNPQGARGSILENMTFNRITCWGFNDSGFKSSGGLLVSRLEQCTTYACGNGFYFVGGSPWEVNTSTTFDTCYAASSLGTGSNGIGYFIQGFHYSKMVTCAADSNSKYGYFYANNVGFEFDTCGAESNGVAGSYDGGGNVNTIINASCNGL